MALRSHPIRMGLHKITGLQDATDDMDAANLRSVRSYVNHGGGNIESNTAYGTVALDANTTGYRNTAVGNYALYVNTVGYANTAVGFQALYNSTGATHVPSGNPGGQQSTAIGHRALFSNTTGYQNQAFGADCLYACVDGTDNTGCGMYALNSLVSGKFNTAMGFNAARSTLGDNNTHIGKGAAYAPVNSADNTSVGYHAMYGENMGSVTITSGSRVGAVCTVNWSAAEGITFKVGSQIVVSGVTPSGYNGTWTITASTTTSVTYTAGADPGAYVSGGTASNLSLYSVTGNSVFGYNAFGGARNSDYNVVIGYGAAELAQDTDFSVVIGYQAARTVNANYHVSVGYRAGFSQTTGIANTNIGNGANHENATGSYNTAVGDEALYYSTSSYNCALGYHALLSTAVGGNSGGANTAMGYLAGLAVTTGANNTFLGYRAGDSTTTGSNVMVLGYNSDASTATVSNEITLGNSSIATLRCQVTSITALSDARDKAEIAPMPSMLGFIGRLNPVTFTWNMRDGGKVGIPDSGFIAQELASAQQETGTQIPGLVYDANPERLEAAYGKLIPVLVKAIQELSTEIEILKRRS